jgi:methylated-DNA-protein-cysteine methyltransferase-like protein
MCIPIKRRIKMDKSSFFQDVYEVVKLIPPGRVTSYGAIANYLGTKSSARMVGWALNSSFGQDIPAHRVVNRMGVLTGKVYFGDNNKMQRLLEAEGIEIIDNQISGFDQVFWDPSKELI